MRVLSETVSLRDLAVSLTVGVLASLVTGLVENPPEASIVGARYYGYPLVWRIAMTTISNSVAFLFLNLAIDALFWIIVMLCVAFFFVPKLLKIGVRVKRETLLLILVLLAPLGVLMDFVHELGHAVWAVAVGGRLAYMQIAYLEVYPRLAVVPQLVLGHTSVDGLNTEFAHGLFLLGGSMMTNLAAWLLGLVQTKMKFGRRTRAALSILGVFGMLDLPFYVFFPQIGLSHWIFFGGRTPEPLIGARKIGVPDPVFYAFTCLLSAGLAFLYLKAFKDAVSRNSTAESQALRQANR